MTAQSAAFLDDLAPGSAMSVAVTAADGSDTTIALVRTPDGAVFALDDECSHGRASLGEGDVDGTSVECWKHGARFDVRTGRPLGLPATRPVLTYPVTLDGEVILVDLDAPADPTTSEN